MGADALLLKIPGGTFELRKPQTVGGAPARSITTPLRHVESGLRTALWSQRLAMIDLLGPGRVTLSMLNDPEAIISELLMALEMGRLELAPPNEGKAVGSAEDAAWAAYLAFQAQVGREFTVAARSHRLVPRERVDSVKREREYDMVPAAEAATIVGNAAKTKAAGALSTHIKVLLESLCDMRTASNKEGFVLLRAPVTLAARYVAPEDVITPAKLKELAESHWVEVWLECNDGQPWMGRYKIQLPNGNEVEGQTDEKGMLRIDHIPAGSCTFMLPGMAPECWGGPASPKGKTAAEPGVARQPIEPDHSVASESAADTNSSGAYVVAPGDCLSSIAAAHGFPDADSLFKHGDNESLSKERSNAHVLMEGDKVALPTHPEHKVQLATNKSHRIVVTQPRIGLRVRLLDVDGSPLANKEAQLRCEDTNTRASTDSDGWLEKEVVVTQRSWEIIVALDGNPGEQPSYGWRLGLGKLDPINFNSGVQQRLANLGYWPQTEDDLELVLPFALRAFQEDHGLQATGEANQETRDCLMKEHANV